MPDAIIARWTGWDNTGLEHVRLMLDAEGAVIQGLVLDYPDTLSRAARPDPLT